MEQNIFMCIDLKSFFASVECADRGLDPFTTNLVVSDPSRGNGAICLAITPAMKALGIRNRCRIFEIPPGVQYLTALPRMKRYMEVSAQVYGVYLRYISPEDIHVYSIDECFIDATPYLAMYNTSPKQLAQTLMNAVFEETHICATAGVGTNLFLAKVALDITAKHVPDHIGWLDEKEFREKLWSHRPITDFWRVGNGYAKKLEEHGLYTMGDIARCSIGKPNELYNEELLYKLFGINAELLIDHAWGYEPCTMEQVKAYKPETNSVSSGQVLHCPYDYDKAKLIVKEMTDQMVLDLVDKGLVTDQLVLTIGYDIENLSNPNLKYQYKGEVTIDRYGRKVPKHAHGTANLKKKTSSTRLITNAVMDLYDRIVDEHLLVPVSYTHLRAHET